MSRHNCEQRLPATVARHQRGAFSGSATSRDAPLHAGCGAHGCKLIELFSERGVGGAAPADQRPGLSAAIAGVKQLDAGILLVATRHRLARDTLVAALVEQRVHRLGAAIRTVDGSENADTPEGLLVRRIIDAFAEYERLTIQARAPRPPLP